MPCLGNISEHGKDLNHEDLDSNFNGSPLHPMAPFPWACCCFQPPPTPHSSTSSAGLVDDFLVEPPEKKVFFLN
jgi:hypothetical protein